MSYKNILAYKDGAIGIIKINRPEVRNALDSLTQHEIEQVLNRWENNEDIRVIVITGEGMKSFVAGADIKQLKEKTATDALLPGLSGLCSRIENSNKVTIAAINGFALGGGCEIALACDIRIAAEHAKFGFPELNLSIIPGAGGTQRLSRIIGKGRALDIILSGEIISAKRAEEIGLVTHVVPKEDLWQAVLDKVARILEKGPLAVQLVKLVFHQGYDSSIHTALTMEKLAQSILFNSHDKEEGTTAFIEKRKPFYSGH